MVRKSRIIAFCGSLAFAGTFLALSACGDDVTKVTNVTSEVSGMEVVASIDSIGKCDSSALGKTVFASDENSAYICADSGWVPLSKSSERNNGSSCSVETLSDSSGYKIVCGGDSVGVIKNGENGSDGKDGADGKDDNNNCNLASDSSGVVKFACGKSDTIVLYKAHCGDFTYDPAQKFCFREEKTYDYCASASYDPTLQFCQSGVLYDLCGGNSYDVTAEFCQFGTIYSLCGGKSYDGLTEYCDGDSVYDGTGEFTDVRDKKIYRTVKIGSQIWMAENLKHDYRYGTVCYDNDTANCEIYGRLYTWAAAMDSAAVFSEDGKGCGKGTECTVSEQVRGICPEGWHLPNLMEWATLESVVAKSFNGKRDSVGYALKSTSGWYGNGNGSDAFGFGALPAGFRLEGTFYDIRNEAHFWTSIEYSTTTAFYRYLSDNSTKQESSYDFKNSTASVRCVKN